MSTKTRLKVLSGTVLSVKIGCYCKVFLTQKTGRFFGDDLRGLSIVPMTGRIPIFPVFKVVLAK